MKSRGEVAIFVSMKVLKNVFGVFFLSIFLSASSIYAQDTLPKFSVVTRGGGKVVISWVNPYQKLVQISVQRSSDSVKRFTTMYAASSPELPVNGVSDAIPQGAKVYYRIFYVLEGGAFFFTASKQPTIETIEKRMEVDKRRERIDDQLGIEVPEKTKVNKGAIPPAGPLPPEPKKYNPFKPLFVQLSDTQRVTIFTKDFSQFRDSIRVMTKDTLIQIAPDSLVVKAYNPPFGQRVSQFVFIDKDGYLAIKLLDADKVRYDVLLFEEDEKTIVLSLKHIKEPYLVVDKSNFYKGGWYKYTLLENGRIKEKNKIYLPKDF